MLCFPLLEFFRLIKDGVWDNWGLERKKVKTKKVHNLGIMWKTHQISEEIQRHGDEVPQKNVLK